MIRFFDIIFSFLGLAILSPILIIIWFIGFFENGSPIFVQRRMGINEKIFVIIKFRTMKKGTKSVATHLINTSNITSFGHLLRITKLDEIPQLYNVLKGEMSMVGPRPCLTNQKKLIRERKLRGVFQVKPGITGLAQISGITMRTPTLLAESETIMIQKLNIYYYFYYIIKTFFFIFKK